ncbi:MAG: hypothetical protein IT379_41040 [Deltaproteobacteria bacterium]|nr:hypothetical protein [Deltaproteobacteria bacterium]
MRVVSRARPEHRRGVSFARGGPPHLVAAAALTIGLSACATSHDDASAVQQRSSELVSCVDHAPRVAVASTARVWHATGWVVVWATPPAALGPAADGHPTRRAWARFGDDAAIDLGEVLTAAIAAPACLSLRCGETGRVSTDRGAEVGTRLPLPERGEGRAQGSGDEGSDRVLVVAPDGVLSSIDRAGCRRTIARDALPEIAVSPSASWVAYTGVGADGHDAPAERAAPREPSVRVAALDPGSSPRVATTELDRSDRPIFQDDGTLVVVGARAGELPGVHLVELRSGAVTQVTNVGMRVGEGIARGFVPLPARHGSMRIEGGVLRYDDGEGWREVPLRQRARGR